MAQMNADEVDISLVFILLTSHFIIHTFSIQPLLHLGDSETFCKKGYAQCDFCIFAELLYSGIVSEAVWICLE